MAYGVNAPFGLLPLGSFCGGVWTEKTNVYRIAASTNGATTYATSIFQGDPVIWSTAAITTFGAGAIVPYATNTSTSTTPLIGVFSYCTYYDSNNNLQRSNCWIAGTPIYPNTLIKAYVVDDPTVEYSVQVSSVTASALNSAWTSQIMGYNANLITGGVNPFTTGINGIIPPSNPATGNTQTGVSAFYIEGLGSTTPPALTATVSFKVNRFDTNVKNLSAIVYPTNAAGAPTPGNNLGIAGGYFLNVIGRLNGHVNLGNGVAGPTIV